MKTNASYLNRTQNKAVRPVGTRAKFRVWHETMSQARSDNASPTPTLDWNLLNIQTVWSAQQQRYITYEVYSSYNDLLSRDGTRYLYVNPDLFIAWGAGVNTRIVVDGITYAGAELNTYGLHTEFDGPCDGLPVTSAQYQSAIEIMLEDYDTRGIPLDRKHHITHAEAVAAINPAYRTDPRGVNLDRLVADAQRVLAQRDTADGTKQILALAPTKIETTLGQWQRAWQRHNAMDRGFSLSAQSFLYGECRRLGVEPWYIIGSAHTETNMGRMGAGRANNWLNIREYSADRPHIVIDGRMFEQHGTVEFGIHRAILMLADNYAYRNLTTLEQVVNVWAPASDGNDPDLIIKKILEDRAYILEH